MVDYRALDSICVVFLHGIGDFVLLTPSLRKMKALNPSLRITVALRKELGLRRLAEGLGLLEEVLEISLPRHPRFYVPWVFWTREYLPIRKKLREAAGGRRFGRTVTVYGQLVPTAAYKVLRPVKSRMHRIDAFASELGLSLTPQERNSPALRVPAQAAEEASLRLRQAAGAGKTVIGIQRNTLDRTRRIGLGAAQGFVDGLNRARPGLFFVVFADRASYRLEEEADGGHLLAPNLAYSLDLPGGSEDDALSLAAMVRACDYVLSVDSAVFNLACALGKSTLGVFNTYKVRPSQRALEREDILAIDGDPGAEELLDAFGRLTRARAAEAR
ncbi:MAG: hypothetical protein Kow0025_12790 [Thermodesulfovibrionales bacterium]